ncbi:DUF481 domain-containing protein [Hydrogenimonas cancrithermarum]|uniref:DUF481 domain-containing protein n=1 Tax=Hydrogenimonas cancrithermarum TaxID=2993563 RepID=A0ABN6WV29_9BACT|nr:DUF481 domain-containing protein [Hydrogenimonas cancrithermarum]BDY12838.1 hypothetical protein HCR_11500 [Hydrogenimonas cancrithermarum]BDY12955.1 hypothetical protein HCR_12670 [Hydrogenimonas cancrithermarum]
MIRHLLTALLCLFAAPLFAYVDISPIEIGEHPGTSGSLALSLSNQRGNTEKTEIGLDLDLRYDSNASYAIWALGGYNYTDTLGAQIENKGFAHLRYLYKISDPFYAEAYIQTESNKLREIENRSLAGAGVRYRFYDDRTYGRIYFGMGLLYERLRFSNPEIDPDEYNTRFSGYLHYSKNFSNKTEINAYLFYQPKIDAWEDYTVHSIAELQTPIFENFYLLLRLINNYDSTPPKNNDVKTYDVAQKVSLMWKF